MSVRYLPTHTITSENGLSYAVAFDDQTPQMLDPSAVFDKTIIGNASSNH
ncbi:MAG: hypothetical protein JW860_15625 [Sedimentisphaerales bacterium]|nr:hypothetical protein [Sedimentisphaerales bacterium]